MPETVFPFLVSCGRSGSTLLRSMMDTHPDLAIPGESFFITKLLPRVGGYSQNGFDVKGFIDDAIALGWSKRKDEPTFIDKWGIDNEELRRFVIDMGPTSYPDAVRMVFRYYADLKQKPLYGDKTPAYITGITEIAGILPETRFVHLVRDGRNVALAFKTARFGPKSMEEIALHWRARVTAGRRAGVRLGTNRYMEISYEDLVGDCEGSLRSVCRWLGLDFHSRMLDHRDSVKELKLAFENTHRNVLRPVQKGMRDWRTEMSSSDLRAFEFIAGDALQAFGYELAHPESGLKERTVIGARRCYAEAKKVSRRMRGLSSAEWW